MNKNQNDIDTTDELNETSDLLGDTVDKIVELEEKLAQTEAKYRRALADYQNLENRTQSRMAEVGQLGKKRLLMGFIDVLDTIENAQGFVTDPGLAMIKGQLEKLLSAEGVSKKELLGTVYDPEYATVLDVVSSDEDDKVVEVVAPCYLFSDKLFRAGLVRVGKKSN